MATKKAPAPPAKAAKTVAAPPAPKAEKPAKAPKAEKPPKVERTVLNGITVPKEGTTTGRIWDIANEVSKAQKRPATRAEVMEKAVAEEINEATVATQYQRWRTAYEVPRAVAEPKAPAAPAAPKAPAKKAAKAATAPA